MVNSSLIEILKSGRGLAALCDGDIVVQIWKTSTGFDVFQFEPNNIDQWEITEDEIEAFFLLSDIWETVDGSDDT